MRADFRAWLVSIGTSERVVSDIVSRVSRLEKVYGSLDIAYANALISSIAETIPSRIQFNGNVANGSATLRSALKKYINFIEK